MSSGDFNNLVLRNTTSYNPDGSFISTGYVFTTTAKGKQNWTNNLNLNNVTASTLTLNSTLIIASSIVNDLQVNSTLNASTIHTQLLGFSTLVGSTISTNTINTTQLVASGAIITSTLTGSTIYGGSIFGTNVGVSSLSASTIQTDTLQVNSTLTASTITANLLNYSSLIGSTILVSTLYASTLFTRLGNYSTLVGSTITTNSLGFSTMVGSTITLDTIIVNSSVYTSTFATGSLNFSTLFGSTIIANTVTVNSTINASTALNSTIVLNTQSATPATHGYKFYLDQGVGSNETGIYVSNSNYPSNQGVSLGMINAGGSNYNSYAKIQGKTSGSAGITNVIIQPDGGQVGIGTTNPQALVDIFLNSTMAAGSMFIYNNNSGLNSSGNDLTVSELNMGSIGGGNYYDSIRVRIPNGSSSDSARLDFCTPAGASNNTQTTRISVMPSTGFVGIGTTNPITLLHVLGSTLTQTLNVQSTLVASTTTTTLLNYSSLLGSTITANTMTLNSTLSVSTTTSRLLNYSSLVGSTITANTMTANTMTSNSTIFGSTIITTGNVGIGTTNPSASLDVNGNLQLTQSLTIGTSGQFVAGSIYSDTNWGMIFRAKQANPGIAEFMWANSLNSELMRITSSGNVGIGRTNPSEKLDVNGSILANGIYSLVNGTININGYVSLQSGGPANTGYIEFRRAGGTRDGYIGFSNTADFFFILEQLRNIRFFIGGTEHMVIATSGNVGIGTTNPNQGKLQVSGRTILGYISGSKGGFLIDNEDYTGSFPAIQGVDSSINVNSILLNPYGGNVGIGSTTPNYTLDVRGTNRVYGYSLTNAYSDNIFFNVNAEDSANGNGSAIVYSNSIQLKAGDLTWAGPTRSYGSKIYIGGGYSAFGAINHSYISMETAGSERMRISAEGNVGIGTTNPVTRLAIATGIATTTTGGTTQYGGIHLEPNGTNNTISGITFGGNGGGSIYIRQSQGGIICQTSDQYGSRIFFQTTDDYGVGAKNRMTITEAGNVGIGLTSPTYNLQLANDSAAKPGSGGLWTVISDERLKKDIILADTERCYDIVKNLPLKRYTWRDEVYTIDQVKDRTVLGWIAQDVEKVFPKAVSSRPFKYNKKYTDEAKTQLISEEVIEDCRDLNAGQLYTVMYGAVQQLISDKELLMETVNNQASTISTLQSNLSSLMKWVGYS
jgi:hypothetical protein